MLGARPFFLALNAFVADFHPKSLPPMLRANYAREFFSWLLLPLMLGALEGGTMAIIVKKMFQGVDGISPVDLDLAVAAISAAPNTANLTSFIWAALAHGRTKIRFISALQLVTCTCVAAIAAVPISTSGLWLLVALVAIARIAWTGVITVRTAVWRNNYPRANRALIAGKMAFVQALILAIAGLAIGEAMDIAPASFRYLFPILALAGYSGNSIYRKVRLRGQRRLQRAEQDGRATMTSRLDPRGLVALLREDRLYARFMWWMSVFGFGNLMLGPPLVILLNDEFHTSYLEGILVTTVIPIAVMPIAIPAWSRLLTRMHVIRFRAIHGWTFVAAAALIFLADLFHSLPIMYCSSVVMGLGFAGGSLAWNLGHHDFAPAHRDSEYMALHVTLNGIRGAIAPFVAIALYAPMAAAGMGAWFFLICFLVNLVGLAGFIAMKRLIPPPNSPQTPQDAAEV
ncbi:MAG: MFS transporter [Phycisphaerales bacterium]|nr:MFS transporter [Phycisphaerales bacterium]